MRVVKSLIVVSLIALGLILGYKNHRKTYPEKVASIAPAYLIARNWDNDREKDGLEFYLLPKDKKGELIGAYGRIDVSLWRINEKGRKGSLLEEWNVDIAEGRYDVLKKRIRLEYRNYVPSDEKEEKGYVEIVFKPRSGGSFKSIDGCVILN